MHNSKGLTKGEVLMLPIHASNARQLCYTTPCIVSPCLVLYCFAYWYYSFVLILWNGRLIEIRRTEDIAFGISESRKYSVFGVSIRCCILGSSFDTVLDLISRWVLFADSCRNFVDFFARLLFALDWFLLLATVARITVATAISAGAATVASEVSVALVKVPILLD